MQNVPLSGVYGPCSTGEEIVADYDEGPMNNGVVQITEFSKSHDDWESDCGAAMPTGGYVPDWEATGEDPLQGAHAPSRDGVQFASFGTTY